MLLQYLSNLVSQDLVKRRADPIHAKVNDVFDRSVPARVDGQKVGWGNDIEVAVRVLVANNLSGVTVAGRQNQVARAARALHEISGLGQGGLD